MNGKLNFALALLTLGITSCKEDITFDQEAYKESIKKAFVVENVDPAHQWATVGQATASITVAQESGETYSVRLYDGDPIGSSKALTLLAEGTVTDGSTLNLTFNYALSQPYAYVALFDREGYMTVYPSRIADGRLTLQIGTATAQAPMRRAAIEPQFEFAEAPADADFATAVPADALLVSQYGNDTKDAMHNYKMAETTDVQDFNPHNGNFRLYVSGTKNINYSQPGDGAREMYFYILPGAHLTFKNNAFTQNGRGNFKMYVAKGATVTFEKGLQSYMQLYNRGTVEVKGGYKPGIYGGGIFYNQGTFTIDGADRYYAAPDNIENPLTLNNDESQFINDGQLLVGGVVLEGSSHFINNDTARVTMNTVVNSNGATWVNNGVYTTGKFLYTAGSTDVVNNCKLYVGDLFRINLGDTDRNSFQLNGGASVETKNFEAEGPTFIRMGSGSLFKVTETAKFYIAKDIYGIYGPSTGQEAVFQAKKIERLYSWQTNQGFTANYFGHLYVATDDHFNFGYSDKSAQQTAAGEVGSQPYYRLDAASGAKMTSYDGAKANLSDEGCGAAYSGTPTPQPEVKSFAMRYCFEDNFPSAGDYDFNDVVMTVTPTLSDKTLSLKVSLDAVGAQKTLGAAIRIVGLHSTDLESYEVKQAFAAPPANFGEYRNITTSETFLAENQAPNNTSSMVVVLFKDAHWAINPVAAQQGGPQNSFYNTVKRDDSYAGKQYVAPKEAEYTLVFKDAEKARSMISQNLFDVFIVEPYNGSYYEVHTVQNGFKTAQVITDPKPKGALTYEEAYGDNMPWAIMVPGNFKYPNEWQVIGKKESGALSGAYQTSGHSFGEWAENSSTATDWYDYPTSGLVFE
jgi:LruC domain-containing protein